MFFTKSIYATFTNRYSYWLWSYRGYDLWGYFSCVADVQGVLLLWTFVVIPLRIYYQGRHQLGCVYSFIRVSIGVKTIAIKRNQLGIKQIYKCSPPPFIRLLATALFTIAPLIEMTSLCYVMLFRWSEIIIISPSIQFLPVGVTTLGQKKRQIAIDETFLEDTLYVYYVINELYMFTGIIPQQIICKIYLNKSIFFPKAYNTITK